MNLGKRQRMIIQRFTSVGAYLNTEKGKSQKFEDILLPKKYLDASWKVGEEIEVFLLKDSDDRLITTTETPKIEVGQFAMLEVKDVSRIGAFLDWGLDKDLFLPFKEQIHKVKSGEKVLVYCYIDKSERIAATMRVKNHFYKPKNIKENDYVNGIVYSSNPEIGVFVLVEDKYNGLIPKKNLIGALPVGEHIKVRVEAIKPDGKIDLSMKSRSHESMDDDAKIVLKKLDQNRGFLPLNDKSKPQIIYKELNMSKAQFKRVTGRLFKLRIIEFTDSGIKLIKE